MSRGVAVYAGIPADVVRATAREAEAAGYGSFWVNHPPATDGRAALGAAARDTHRVELGVGVIPLQNRTPASVIEGVRANTLPADRLLLGVGSANPGALNDLPALSTAPNSSHPISASIAANGPRFDMKKVARMGSFARSPVGGCPWITASSGMSTTPVSSHAATPYAGPAQPSERRGSTINR